MIILYFVNQPYEDSKKDWEKFGKNQRILIDGTRWMQLLAPEILIATTVGVIEYYVLFMRNIDLKRERIKSNKKSK